MNVPAFFKATWKRTFLVIALIAFCEVRSVAEDARVLFQQQLPRVPALVLAEVALAGKPRLMMLDTGSNTVFLDNSLNDSLGSEIAEKDAVGAGGAVHRMKLYAGPSLKLGELSGELPRVALTDLRMLSLFTGRPVAGILSMQQLRAGKLLLSYDERIVQLHRGPWKLNEPDCREIELEVKQGIPRFKADILGQPTMLILDTGFDGCIQLEARVFDALVQNGSIELSKVETRALALGGMVDAVKRGWFLRGELMGKNLVGVSVESNPKVSLLGMEWLYGFNTEIDYTARKFRYQCRRDASLPGDLQMMLGAFLLYDENGSKVEKLQTGGGAVEDAGMKLGDVIEEFGSLKAGEMNAVTMREAVADAAGKEVAVRFLRKSDGEHVSAKLKLPPTISDWNFSGRDIFKGK